MRKGLIRVRLTLQEHLSQEVARTPIGSVTSSFKTKITCKGASWHSGWLPRRHDSIQLGFQTLSALTPSKLLPPLHTGIVSSAYPG